MAIPSRRGQAGEPPLRADTRSILINGVVAMLLGTGITVLIHEIGHWVAGALLGSTSYLFAFWVEQRPPLTGGDAAIAALAGPALSLLVGTATQILQPFRFRGDFAHLLWIWIACTSLASGAVHLAIAPFAGDVAVAIDGFGWPNWTAWLATALGVLGLVSIAQQWAIHSTRLCGQEPERLRSFSLHPWLIGLLVTSVLSLGLLSFARAQLTTAEILVVVLAGMAHTFFAPVSLALVNRINELEEPLLVRPWPVAGLLGFAALTVFNFAISSGLQLG